MFGHAHAVFPGKDFASIKGADIAKGTLNVFRHCLIGVGGEAGMRNHDYHISAFRAHLRYILTPRPRGVPR
jgi:hypothetical protein